MRTKTLDLKVILYGLGLIYFIVMLSSCQSGFYKSVITSKQIQQVKNPRIV